MVNTGVERIEKYEQLFPVPKKAAPESQMRVGDADPKSKYVGFWENTSY